MSNKFYKLEEIADFTGINNYFQPTVKPSAYAEAIQPEFTPWTEADFEEYFEKVNEKSLYIAETADPWGKFKQLYTNWMARNGAMIGNQIYALMKKYNPLENYNRLEQHSGTDTNVKTPKNWQTVKKEDPGTFKETVKQTPTNWETSEIQTPTNWQATDTKSFTNRKDVDTQRPDQWKKTTKQLNDNHQNESSTVHGVVPFNGTDFLDASRDVTATKSDITEEQTGTFENSKEYQGSETNTHSQAGTYQTTTSQSGTFETVTSATGTRSETTEQSGTMTDEMKHGHKIETSGNIGVLSSQDMIRQTIELYDVDFAERWLKRFFDSCCVYV